MLVRSKLMHKNQVSIHELGFSKEAIEQLMTMRPKVRTSKSKVGVRYLKVHAPKQNGN